jgi:hypothetical protein
MASTNSALIIPPTAPGPGTNDIRPIKAPLVIPDDWWWLWWAIGIVVALALIAAAVALFIALSKKKAAASLAPVLPPHVRAKQKLREALALISDPNPFCTAVSGVLRNYLEERFRFHAPERTTDEFLLELQATNLLLPDQKQSLGEFLQRCDLVKFARLEPTETELRALFDAADRLIDETAPTFSLNQPLAGPPPANPPSFRPVVRPPPLPAARGPK